MEYFIDANTPEETLESIIHELDWRAKRAKQSLDSARGQKMRKRDILEREIRFDQICAIRDFYKDVKIRARSVA